MKIAFVTHDYNRHGGHARYVAELVAYLKHHHEVHVFANKWEENDPEKIFFHKVPAIRLTALTTVLSFLVPATFLINKKDFDIVHSQGLCGLGHTVSTAHFIQCRWLDELKNRRKSLGISTFLWKWLVAPLEKIALSKFCSKRVIAISKNVKNDLIELYKLNESQIDLIYHGVDLQKFNPANKCLYRLELRQKLNLNTDQLVGLFVGNLQKGANSAIKAVAKNPAVHLVLVTGSDSKKEKETVKNLGIESRVHWVPLSKEIEKWFSMADFFIFPTLYEPFGMVISEAMATGLPVITSRSAGAAELITDRVSGLLIQDSWNSDEIASAVDEIANDVLKREAIGRNAREVVCKFTWKRCAEETLRVYKQILSSNG